MRATIVVRLQDRKKAQVKGLGATWADSSAMSTMVQSFDCTGMRAHLHTCTRTHACAPMYADTHAHGHVHAPPTGALACARARTRNRTPQPRSRPRRQPHERPYPRLPASMSTTAPAPSPVHAHAHALVHARVHVYARTCTHAHARSRTCAPTRTRTRTRSHSRPRSRPRPCPRARPRPRPRPRPRQHMRPRPCPNPPATSPSLVIRRVRPTHPENALLRMWLPPHPHIQADCTIWPRSKRQHRRPPHERRMESWDSYARRLELLAHENVCPLFEVAAHTL